MPIINKKLNFMRLYTVNKKMQAKSLLHNKIRTDMQLTHCIVKILFAFAWHIE